MPLSHWLLARHLFPAGRLIYRDQIGVAILRGDHLYEPDELGHPYSFIRCLDDIHRDRIHRLHGNGAKEQVSPRQIPPQAIDELLSTTEPIA